MNEGPIEPAKKRGGRFVVVHPGGRDADEVAAKLDANHMGESASASSV